MQHSTTGFRGSVSHRSTLPLVLASFLLTGAGFRTEAREENDSALRWGAPVEIAKGPARRGPWRMNESEFHFVDDPAVAPDPETGFGLVWVDQTKKDVFFRPVNKQGGFTTDAPVNLSNSSDTFSWLPRIAFHPSDGNRIFVIWQEIVFSGGSHGGEIFFAESRDGGTTFSNPINLSKTRNGAGKGRLTPDRWHNGSFDLAVSDNGGVFVAWTEYEGRLRLTHIPPDGNGPREPTTIAGRNDAKPARAPTLALGDDGKLHLAWTVGGDPEADIHYTFSEDEGKSFETPSRLVPGDGHADAPKLAVAASGKIHLVYANAPRGRFRRYHLRYARSADGGGSFEDRGRIPARPDSGIHSVHFPMLRLDGKDNLYLSWELFPAARPRSRGLGFTRSTDGGESFETPRVVPGSDAPELGFNGSQQGLLMQKLGVREDGSAAVVNSSFAAGEQSLIRFYPLSNPTD